MLLKGGRVLLTEILLPRIVRRGTAGLTPPRRYKQLEQLESIFSSSMRVSDGIMPPSDVYHDHLFGESAPASEIMSVLASLPVAPFAGRTGTGRPEFALRTG